MDYSTICVVCTYLMPNELASFLFSNNSMKMKFRYDASKCDPCITVSLGKIDRSQHDKYYSVFPNIILTGISILWLGFLFAPIYLTNVLPYPKYKYVRRIVSASCYCTVANINISGIGLFANLRAITFPTSHIEDILPLSSCRKLRTIDMSKCFDIKNVSQLAQLRLKDFGFPRTCDSCHEFPKKLKSFIMFYNGSDHHCKHLHWRQLLPRLYFNSEIIDMGTLVTSHLRSLHLRSRTFVNLPLCDKVTNLELMKCQINIDPDLLPSVMKLTLSRMNRSFDINFVANLKSLKWLLIGVDGNTLDFGYAFLESFIKISECSGLKRLSFQGSVTERSRSYHSIIMDNIGKIISLESLRLEIMTYCDIMKLHELTNLRTLMIYKCWWNGTFCFPDIGLTKIIVENCDVEKIIVYGKVRNVVLKKCDNLRIVQYEDDCTLFDLRDCGDVAFKRKEKKDGGKKSIGNAMLRGWRKLVS